MSDTLRAKFIAMAPARLMELGECVASLENDTSAPLIRKISRELHTLKGESRLVDIPAIERLSHAAEDVLFSHTRAGIVSVETQQLLYEAIDAIFGWIQGGDPSELEQSTAHVVAKLHAHIAAAPAETGTPAAAAEQPAAEAFHPSESSDASSGRTAADHEAEGITAVDTDVLERIGEMVAHVHGSAIRSKKYGEILVGLAEELKPLCRTDPDGTINAVGAAGLRDYRVRLLHTVRDFREHIAADEVIHQELNLAVRGSRLRRLETVFSAYPTYVRQAAREEGKLVKLRLASLDVQLEPTVLDAIAEPCMHILRNAIAHGIETPEDRRKQGKPETGLIAIAAVQEGDAVRIDFVDDGRGLNVNRIASRAVELKLVSTDELARMSEHQRIQLIFRSGLSTADKITELAGRGVGLDVVATVLERIGGTITLSSRPGLGCTFSLRIPISASIVRAMLLESSNQIFALPSSCITEVFWLGVNEIRKSDGQESTVLRGKLLPLVRLRSALGLRGIKDIFVNKVVVVVLKHGDKVAGIIVERCLGEREIVMRYLEDFLNRPRMTSGVAVLEDNSVLIVLAPAELLEAHSGGRRSRATVVEGGGERQKRHILYAEDSLITREYTASLLRAQGFEVTEVEDGVEALTALRSRTFDMLLTDLQMPRMDGFKLISAVRRDEHLKSIPIIILSTVGAPETRRMALETGADAYMVKSHFGIEGLMQHIRQVLG